MNRPLLAPVFAVLLTTILSTVQPQLAAQPLSQVLVIRVIDGDTIEVTIGSSRDRVRFIGVDTPESTTRVEPYGREATVFTRRWLDERRIWLEHDVELRDRYRRRLAYVWLQPPKDRSVPEIRAKMFNAILLSEGYAQLLTVPPNVRYVDVFRALQTEARQQGKGLWAQAPALAPGASPCDPSYPDVCIPPPPPDLDCSEIPYRRFRVLPPDPHRFDGDHDGIGCER